MKKSSLIALALAATLVLGGGGVFAAGQIARSRAISEENARDFAYVDAGILPEDAEFVSTKFDFEKGRFVYEIEFVSQGIKYEYVLDSVSGEVLEKEKEAVRESRGRASEPASETLPAVIFEETLAPLMGLAEAKARAAEELGQPLSQLNFLEAELIRKEGEPVYSLELKDPEGGFHQFEFNAYSGEVLKESHRMAEETKTATDPAPADSDPADPLPTQPVPVTPDPTGQAPTNPAPVEIGLEKAKAIALKDAGRSAAEVSFTKARKEKEEGKWIYDIEFYVPQQMEYEYEIDIYTGKILEKSVENIKPQPAPTNPAPTNPAPTQPAPTNPAPTNPAPTTPAPTNPAPTNPAPTNPAPTNPAPTNPAPVEIGLEKAKAIALKDAGRSASEVSFTKARKEKDNGKWIYDIEFFVSQQMEYEYEIDIYTGKILEKSVESIKPQPVPTTPAPTQPAPTQPAPTQPAPTNPAPTNPAPVEIGLEKAKAIALKDAGRSTAEVTFTKARKEKDNGKWIYDIEFYVAQQMEYEYEIDIYTGKILEKSAESLKPQPAPTTPAPTQPAPTNPAPTNPAPVEIGLEKAKAIALKDAGRSASEVTFTKARKEKEEGKWIYDIEFFVSQQMEYEYEIDIYTGKILEKSSESIKPQPAPTTPAPTQPAPTNPAPTTPAPTQPVKKEIGLAKAKAIALQDAGLTESQVVFSKAKMSSDDGKLIYELEFYVSGRMEYEYEIDAYTGKILDKDWEEWDD